MNTIKTLSRFAIFGVACSAAVCGTGTLLVLPICWLCFAPVILGGR